MFCLGEGWNNFREAQKDLWVDPKPMRRGSGGKEKSLSGQAHFLVLYAPASLSAGQDSLV